MRANACETGREGFRGRATEGVWSLMGLLVVEPVFRNPDSSKKLSWRQVEFPNEGGAKVQTQRS